MEYEASMHDVLERFLHDERAEPRELPLSLLRAITKDFAYNRLFAYDHFSQIYKGVLPNGEVIAVKRLYLWLQNNEERLENVVGCFMRMRAKQHKNIVGFLGYHRADSDPRGGRDEREMLLCFEYPIGGNLQTYITNASYERSWREHYKIIKGICEGLYYLHQNRIVHLNLTGDKIWFDENNEPKIYDFSCSRLLDQIQSKVITREWRMSMANAPPEFLRNGVITLKTDIYCLGILITEILTGSKKYSILVENILESWRYRLGTSAEDMCLKQIRVCAEIANSCLELDPKKRPDAEHIIKLLVETESTNEFTEPDETKSVDESTESAAQTSSMYDDLERLLHDESAGPRELPLALLRAITDDFAEHQKIGEGEYFVVYKGMLPSGKLVAVKMLSERLCMSLEGFENEIFDFKDGCLMGMMHKNIVRLLGYCAATQGTGYDVGLLCLEYPSGGILDAYITDASHGLSWRTRYKIIKGICEVLCYLHENSITHCDLRTANIWFDEEKAPKIHVSVFTERSMETRDDIYMLGVLIIEILTGPMENYFLNKDEESIPELIDTAFIHKVLKSWAPRLGTSLKDTRLEQIRVCLEVAKSCFKYSWGRPDIERIIQMLSTDKKVSVPIENRNVKLLCRYGGLITAGPWGDETLQYVGGQMGLISFPRAARFLELQRKVEEMDEASAASGGVLLKYQLPGKDLNSLISVSNPEDYDNMMEEYEKLAAVAPDGTAELCVFLFPAFESDKGPDPKKGPDAKNKPYPESVQTMEVNILERLLVGSEKPKKLDILLLRQITDNFSKQRLIGEGGFGAVYKGILQNGNVAIKKFFNRQTIKENMFRREVENLFTIRHDNIVRLLGYCSFTEEELASLDNEKIILAEERERLLCLEYISNGSLENHLTDELRGLEWHTRYEIIVGICKGLNYLHKEKKIIHMDLKPANILLDDLMVPKITDFGLSRLDNNSQTVTTLYGTRGYCAPEYIDKGKSSSKSDVYSLGVIITELVTGSKKEPDLTKVLRRWRHRWLKASKHTPLGYKQVKKCLQLAQRCIQNDPRKRPDIVDIIQELDAMDSKDDQFQISPYVFPPLEDLLGIEPLEIHFPFEPDQQISHSIELSNDTDSYIAFMTKTRLGHFCIEPNKGIVPPRSKCSVTIKLNAQGDKLPNDHYKKKITVLSTRADGALATMDGAGDMFIGKDRNVVDKVNVMVVMDTHPLAEES